MGFLRGFIGFVFGGLLGGAALVVVTTNVPQFDDAGAPDKAVTIKGLKTEPVVTPKTIVGEPVVADPTPAVNETPPITVEATPEVVEEQPDATKSDTTEAEPAPEPAVTEVQPVEVPKAETPKIAWQSQQTEAESSTKKFNLPTISADEPAEKPEETVEEEATDTGISVGKKPSGSLPTITAKKPSADIAKEAPADSRALELNATQYDPKDRPLLGVILLDVGANGLTVDKLKKLNAPLTIAIHIDDPSASERALAYHAAGFEVIAMASDDRNAALNTALNAKQIETALDVMFATVPNAIGLLDSPEAKIQKNSRTAKVIVKGFVNTGHGLVTYTKGLNSVDREARAAGVRTAKVARRLDANSENKALMVRYLDRVSLDAGRDGAAIILGTTAKTTVATIAVWLLGSKGQSVSVAPASAVLLGG